MNGASATHSDSRRLSPSELTKAGRISTDQSLLWANPAWLSVAAAIALALIGIAAIRLTEDPESAMLWAKQTVFFLLGLLAMGAMAIPHPRLWRHISYPGLIVVILLLIFLLLPFVPHSIVRPRHGARRWINLVVTDFQPSELAKIVLVLAMATYLRLRKNYRTLTGLLLPFAIMLIPMVLILVEPDLGTALLFGPVLFAMLIAAGAKLKHMTAIAGAGMITAGVIAGVSLAAAQGDTPRYPVLEKHQVERIQGLVNQIRGDRRQADTINYQAFKAMTLIGAGGFDGLGLERSQIIVRLNRLPVDHNDMIFAVIVNRWGFIGGTMLIVMYFLYVAGLMLTAAMTRSAFGRLTLVGFATIIGAQAIVNIGMNIGLLPITGMTLPFVSYGGSSLVAIMAMTGIAMSIALRPDSYFAERSFEYDPAPEQTQRFDTFAH